MAGRPTITTLAVQTGTDRTMYMTWTWTDPKTKSGENSTKDFTIRAFFSTGSDGIMHPMSDVTTEGEGGRYYYSFSVPSNANGVRVTMKANAKSRDVNGVDTPYWTGAWATDKTYFFSENPPSQPSTPNVDMEDLKLTASIDNYGLEGQSGEGNVGQNPTSSKYGIEFQIIRDNNTLFKVGNAQVVTGHAAYSCTVIAGSEYKVRCRAYDKQKRYSQWSTYSANKKTIPDPAPKIKSIKASSSTSVYIEWNAIATADSYTLEWAEKKEYFDRSDATQSQPGIESTSFTKTGLESGKEYFFRVQAVNEIGESKWSDPKSVILGEKPAAPTSWSSTTTAIKGEDLTLYWIHNSADGSSATVSEIEFDDGTDVWTETVPNIYTEEEDKDKTQHYDLNTSSFSYGAEILWRVRTAGVTQILGEWSVQRSLSIYAQPTVQLNLKDYSGDEIEELSAFPIYVSAITGPSTQAPIGYNVRFISKSTYEYVDYVGNIKVINVGDVIYDKYFDVQDILTLQISAGHVDLENNAEYTVEVVATMNSGLTASQTRDFTVAWEDESYEPDAEIAIDSNTLVAQIRPFCEDEDGELVDGVSLSVYRKEFDGTFTEIASGLDNAVSAYVTDPHPALNFARYRIVAITDNTGAVSFYDPPPLPVKNPNAVIQWDEKWEAFESDEATPMENPNWSGSMLKIPYNIDISESHRPDASLVEYIGREHPVGYYGTQKGHTSVWSMEIPAYDNETLYAIRRLARYSGDVYVREPSGTGYWANIQVSYSKTHCEVTIPISFSIARVEGGV